MTADAFAVVARVVKTHGLKGEVSVAPATEAPFSILEGLDAWFVPPPSGIRMARIAGVRPGPKGPLVLLTGVQGIDAARALIGSEMLVRSVDLPLAWLEYESDDDVSHDGFRVSDAAHGLLGEIVETIITGANDVWVVHGPLGEVLIPVIDDVVLSIDDVERTVVVKLLPGLLPGEDER